MAHTPLTCLQRDFPGRDMFTGRKNHFPSLPQAGLNEKEGNRLLNLIYFRIQQKEKKTAWKEDPQETQFSPTGFMNLSGSVRIFRFS